MVNLRISEIIENPNNDFCVIENFKRLNVDSIHEELQKGEQELDKTLGSLSFETLTISDIGTESESAQKQQLKEENEENETIGLAALSPISLRVSFQNLDRDLGELV